MAGVKKQTPTHKQRSCKICNRFANFRAFYGEREALDASELESQFGTMPFCRALTFQDATHKMKVTTK